MNPPDTVTPAIIAAGGFEVAVALSGLWALWVTVLSPAARQRRVRRLTAWEISGNDFLLFLCCVFVGATVPSALAVYLVRGLHLGEDGAAIVGGAVMHLGVLGGLYGFYRAFGAPSNPGGPRVGLLASLRDGLLTFVIGIPLVDLTAYLWDLLLTKLHLPLDSQQMVDILQNSHSVVLVGAVMLIATFLVPFTEEYVFRAGLFRFLRTRMPRGWSIVLTSVVFGLLHLSWSSFAPLTVLAVIFCYAYERTGSIRTTIIAHALFNLNTFVIIAAGMGT